MRRGLAAAGADGGRPHWVRLGRIVSVFARHGLATLVTPIPWPLAVRDALIELGPAFIKAGLLLSVRTDLVPPALATALHSLQSDVPAVPFEELQRVIESEAGRPLTEAFAHIDPHPLAAASIAQVHLAWLPDGRRVALKVKRPRIDDVMARDLAILRWLAAQAERLVPRLRPFHPVVAANEISRYTQRELDFRREAHVAEHLADHFASWSDVVIPRIYHRSTGMLIMDFIPGFPIDDLAAIAAHGLDRRQLVRLTLDCMLEQILVVGLFHADPHPGNLHITPDGRLALLDFGIVGELDPTERRLAALSSLLQHQGKFDLATHYLLKMATIAPGTDLAAYRQEIGVFYRAFHQATMGEYGFARMAYDVVSLGAAYGIAFPPAVILYTKAMTTLEGVGRDVAPEVNLTDEARPFFEQLGHKLFGPRQWLTALDRALPLWQDLAERLPFDAAMWLDRLVAPATAAPPSPPPLSPARSWLPAVSIVGGVILLLAQVGPDWHGMSLAGLGLLALGFGGELLDRSDDREL